MTIVKLKYDDKIVTTTAEDYLKYNIFDATDENTGDFWPVNKEDVVFIDTEEI